MTNRESKSSLFFFVNDSKSDLGRSFSFVLKEVIKLCNQIQKMAVGGVVRQAHVGQVLQCTVAYRCFPENGNISKGKERTCLLSVNHEDRCSAWETDVTKWLIDTDVNKIKQLP